MYSLIIVDDEKAMLDNLSVSIAWEDLGFKLNGCFTSVEEALNYIANYSVDCIISDFKMPSIDGLEFAELVRDKYPDIVFILLSAYAEFSIAQKAVNLSISDYIVKPITYKKISDALQKAVNTLGSNKSDINSMAFCYSDKYKVLTNMLNKKYASSDEAILAFNKLGIKIDKLNTSFAMVKISIIDYDDFMKNSWPYTASKLNDTLSYIVETENINIIIYKLGFGFLECFLIGDTEDNFFVYMNNLLTQIKNNCFELLSCTIDIETLSAYQNINTIFSYDTVEVNSSLINSIKNEIISGATARAHNLTEELLSPYLDDTQGLQNIAKNLLFKINEHYDVIKIFGITNLDYNKCQTPLFIYNIVDKASMYFSKKEAKKVGFIESAKAYINEHYSEDLSLSKIADAIYISETYLSRSFKDQTGDSIINYIKAVRLTHAKDLLITTDLSIDNICYAVGYNSRNLFYKNFKAFFGVTPKSFRRETDNEN